MLKKQKTITQTLKDTYKKAKDSLKNTDDEEEGFDKMFRKTEKREK